MRLFKRGDSPYFWCEFYVPGQSEPIRKSTKQSDRRLAHVAAQELQREAARPKRLGADQTVKQVVERFLVEVDASDLADQTAASYAYRAVKLTAHLGDDPIASLTRERIEGYIQARRFEVRQIEKHHGEKGATLESRPSAGTIRLELKVLRRLLNWARERKIADIDPRDVMHKFKAKKRRPDVYRWFTEDDYDRLHAHYAAHYPRRADWLAIACYTGMRKEEIHECVVGDVFLGRDMIHCRGDKTIRADRWIPIATLLRPTLERLCAGRPADALLVAKWRGVSNPSGIPAGCKAVGLPWTTAHDCRRTFASWLLQRGVSDRIIADLLGHNGTQLVREVYGHLGSDDYRRAIAVLDQRTDNVRNEGEIAADLDRSETSEIELTPQTARTSAVSATAR